MQAINDYVVIEEIREKPKTIGGFIVADTTTEDIRYLKGVIVSCGNLTQGINVSDTIFYDRHAGHSILFDGNQYRVIRQRDIVLIG